MLFLSSRALNGQENVHKPQGSSSATTVHKAVAVTDISRNRSRIKQNDEGLLSKHKLNQDSFSPLSSVIRCEIKIKRYDEHTQALARPLYNTAPVLKLCTVYFYNQLEWIAKTSNLHLHLLPFSGKFLKLVAVKRCHSFIVKTASVYK